MKHVTYLFKALYMLLAAFVLTGCLSDGDETISLEYGDPRDMIVGRWKVTRHYTVQQSGLASDVSNSSYLDDVWTFLDDGTYTRSSDGSSHRWELIGYTSGEPYYNGIRLDGYAYDISSLGYGRWILEKDGGSEDEYWELDKVPEETAATTKSLISKIVENCDGEEMVCTFTYDEMGNVTGGEWWGEKFTVESDGSYLEISWPNSNPDPSYDLNANGYIASYSLKSYELTMTYDNGYIQTISSSNKYIDEEYLFYYKNNVLAYVTHNNKGIYEYNYSNEDNDANIDLNCIYGGVSNDLGERLNLPMCFGYLGKRQSKLISYVSDDDKYTYSFKYERDKNGRISRITVWETDDAYRSDPDEYLEQATYDIYYE